MCISFVSTAQRRCGTVEYTQKLTAQNFRLEKNQQFEEWIQKKKASRLSFRQQSATYRIPVVVHVIHNGEPVGDGANVSTQQILSQLKVLNDDFRRKNADTVDTPLEFAGVAAGMDIEFVLARRNPQGFATSGIIRVDGGRDEWFSGNNNELKALSYWPSEDYLNIWVCNLMDFLGYAQFPISDLPGLDEDPENALTDGLVVWHEAFGSSDDGDFDLDSRYDKGRTATHEIAHFLGLRHIWGDENNCNGNDHVDDTPVQNDFTEGCPSGPLNGCEDGESKMFQNFTDYTDDGCMNMFTKGQVDRMKIVLENSPRRASLLTSVALEDPDRVDNDLGIARVVHPFPTQCDNTISPVIEISNRGKNSITSSTIEFSVNSEVVESRTFTLDLPSAESMQIEFGPVELADGYSTLQFKVTETNATDDGNSEDNRKIFKLLIDQQTDIAPLRQTFDSQPSNWSVVNSSEGMVWETVPTNYNTSIYFNSYRNLNTGDESWLVSPVLDFTSVSQPSLVFDLSAAKRSAIDDLKILVSTDCGESYQLLDYALPSAFATSSSNWVPSVEKDWALGEYISLQEFAGEGNVRIAFVVKNASGNNVYLDNIEFFVNNDPREASIENAFNIYGYSPDTFDGRDLKIGFNLQSKQDIHLEISDRMGRVVATGDYENVLNQVFNLPISDYMKAGLYLVRLKIDGKQYASRIVITN